MFKFLDRGMRALVVQEKKQNDSLVRIHFIMGKQFEKGTCSSLHLNEPFAAWPVNRI